MRNGGCIGRLFNLLAIIVAVGLIVAILAFVGLYFFPEQTKSVMSILSPNDQSDHREQLATPTLVAVAVLPTNSPTSVPTNTRQSGNLEPTFTPVKQPTTISSEPTNTRNPTSIPSITPTIPPSTPTKTPTPTYTPTPTPTNTGTPGPSPTAPPTRSSFPFTKDLISPIFLTNFANNAQCNWMGIAGEVLDINRNQVPVGSYRVHVWGGGIDERVTVGTAPAYAPSGWEQYLNNAPVVGDYNVQLETPEGTPVSQVYLVQTRASCEENLVYFVFLQNH